MLDYKDIITKHYALGMSGRKIAESLKVSKSGVNDFLRAFQECPVLSYPLPEGITNYGIAALVYWHCGLQHLQGGVPPLRDPAGGDGSPQGCGLLQVPEAHEEDLRSRPADSGRLPVAHHYG